MEDIKVKFDEFVDKLSKLKSHGTEFEFNRYDEPLLIEVYVDTYGGDGYEIGYDIESDKIIYVANTLLEYDWEFELFDVIDSFVRLLILTMR